MAVNVPAKKAQKKPVQTRTYTGAVFGLAKVLANTINPSARRPAILNCLQNPTATCPHNVKLTLAETTNSDQMQRIAQTLQQTQHRAKPRAVEKNVLLTLAQRATSGSQITHLINAQPLKQVRVKTSAVSKVVADSIAIWAEDTDIFIARRTLQASNAQTPVGVLKMIVAQPQHLVSVVHATEVRMSTHPRQAPNNMATHIDMDRMRRMQCRPQYTPAL